MIEAFLLAKGLLGMKNWVWIAVMSALVAAAFVVVSIADNTVESGLDRAEQSGASKAVAEGQAVTLDQVGKANEAEQDIDRGGAAAVDGCVSDARGDSTGCERFAN